MTPSRKPLCVDLDGTLLKTDLLWEMLFQLLRRSPLALLAALLTLRQGRAAFKVALALRGTPDVVALPVNQDLLMRLQAERDQGRKLVLVTASPRPWAEAVAARFTGFDVVLATEMDGAVNLSGAHKAAQLVERYGPQGFDYAGNSRADVAVWQQADRAWVVAAPASVTRAARQLGRVAVELPNAVSHSAALWAALRPHQCAKNLLVFLPLLTAQQWHSGVSLLAALLAFVAFSFAASASYLFNDLLDLSADRAHPRKSRRPLASGALPLSHGLAAAPLLIFAALLLALALPPTFIWMLLAYLVATTAYSLGLKRQPLLDALVLAGLYTLRIVAGGAAIGVPITFWLLAFSVFLFLSLAFAKRYAELLVMLAAARDHAAGRGYRTDDLPLVQMLGIAAGYVSVLVLALYFDSAAAARLYAHPHAMWVFCPLLLWWISRAWLLTHRGEMHDDPVVFALKDRASHLAALLGLLVLLGAA